MILEELVRNLSLTLVGVFVVTLVLIGDLKVSLWVFSCILFTLVGIAGTMRFAGLTIEIMTAMLLILSVGLAVDYSTHIAHKFMVTHADSKDVERKLEEEQKRISDRKRSRTDRERESHKDGLDFRHLQELWNGAMHGDIVSPSMSQ
ncbi:unnamed protein product [Darwinula stevensoni]|uniref:Uncharacterized protein n=1 Tax=Darwinula stevensoni TaxID=69355 RepID=A0A7R9ADA4_9CRUS|nr:unnamed protein product [Darwinula stevensoni]CAG0900899.1 unnamed protein product [Darwinula stevensoni]